MTISAPRWDLSNVFPSLESKEFKAAVDNYKKQVAALEKFFKSKLSKADAKTKAMRQGIDDNANYRQKSLKMHKFMEAL